MKGLNGVLKDKHEEDAILLAQRMAEANVRNLEDKAHVARVARDRLKSMNDLPIQPWLRGSNPEQRPTLK